VSDERLKTYSSLVQLLSLLQSLTRYLDTHSPLTDNQQLLSDQIAYMIDTVKYEVREMECEQLQELTEE
jgi:hypothetical protein